ncbi:MAG: alpha/beta hydrolase [Spirochaetia bacterium]|nr:alpha/beta hydrolase [Spirochaetia bacterium]
MKSLGEIKKYGNPPYRVVLLHGGPGAAGDMEPVSINLSKNISILEPYQSALSVTGQVEELKQQLDANASYPVILAGHSWGAWLAWIFAAKYPKPVKKIVLISSPPFLESYADQIKSTRMSRLDNAARQEIQFLTDNSDNAAVRDRRKLFHRLGELLSKADSYNPDNSLAARTDPSPEIYLKIWPEAAAMRKSGELLGMSKRIRCPITAIHGDYDPHPAEGVRQPLAKAKRNFKFILLAKCGHTPWIEKEAQTDFFKELLNAIDNE